MATTTNFLPGVINSSRARSEEIVTLQVTTLKDENDASTKGTGLSLRDAILLAVENPTQQYRIQLQAGETYKLTLDGSREHFSQTGDLDIFNGSNVTIETIGGDTQATIDASGLTDRDSVFHVWGKSTLTLNNVIITGGKQSSQGSGAGLFINGDSTVNLQDSTVTKNEAGKGAGIYVSNGTLNLDDSQVTQNTAHYFGGGVFAKNKATINIEKSQIADNDAHHKGGGIFAIEEGTKQIALNVQDSIIVNNTSRNGGGGIGSQGGVGIEIGGSTFRNNTTERGPGGGAIYSQGENSDRTVINISGSRFEDNKAVNSNLGGGAIYGEKANITVVHNSSFINNSVIGSQDASGGAIFATNFSNLNIQQANFTDNKVNVARGGSGGAIASFYGTTVNLKHTQFLHNSASETGGAMRLVGGTNHNLDHVHFTENTTRLFGGAISFSDTNETTVSNAWFVGNISQGDGGAMKLRRGNTHWSNVRFVGNQATGAAQDPQVTGDGGVGILDGGNHSWHQVIATENRAAQDGGVFDVKGTDRQIELKITDSEFNHNRAEDDAGVLDLYSNTLGYATIHLDGINARNNSAGDSGGAVRAIDGVELDIVNSNFIENQAGDKANPQLGIYGQGGGLHIEGSQANVVNTKFLGNKAVYGGGGILVALGRELPVLTSPGVLKLVNSQVNNNESLLGNAGGILADQGSEVDIVNTHLNHNQSALAGAAIYAAPKNEGRPAAQVTMINSIAMGNVADSNQNGTGTSAVYISPPLDDVLDDTLTAPAKFKIYNSILANTVTGNGQVTADYGGAAPVAAHHSLVSKLENLSTWSDNSNLLNVTPNLLSLGNGLYVPTADSPVVDAGANRWLIFDIFDIDGDGNITELLPVDSQGSDRIVNGTVDLGPVEFAPNDGLIFGGLRSNSVTAQSSTSVSVDTHSLTQLPIDTDTSSLPDEFSLGQLTMNEFDQTIIGIKPVNSLFGDGTIVSLWAKSPH